MKSEKWKVKSEKWKVKSEKWKVKSEKWKVKSLGRDLSWMGSVLEGFLYSKHRSSSSDFWKVKSEKFLSTIPTSLKHGAHSAPNQ